MDNAARVARDAVLLLQIEEVLGQPEVAAFFEAIQENSHGV
jgi:hypothetical protein